MKNEIETKNMLGDDEILEESEAEEEIDEVFFEKLTNEMTIYKGVVFKVR